MNTTTVYAEIVKAERNEAGDLVVVGKATGPDLDLDKQICDPGWLGKAMPEWFSTGANIREMHSAIAAGVGTELAQSGDSWMVTSTVIDASSAKKVEAGVLKGYSIGISNPKVIKDAGAPGGRIVDGQIVEVSLVDRPCNPTAMLMLSKAAKPGMQVKAASFDREHMLVKVEEYVDIPENAEQPNGVTAADLINEAEREKQAAEDKPEDDKPDVPVAEQAATIIAEVKSLVPALTKGTAQADIAAAQAVIAAIGQLIVSEATSLAAGQLSDACDIDELLCAVRAMRWFIQAEASEEPDDSMITIELADVADTTKTTAPAVTKATDPAEEDRITKLEKKFTEVIEASGERVKALEAELAKVKQLPVPGGPVLSRTATDIDKAASKEALLAKVAKYRQMADDVNDPRARTGYLELATALETTLS